MKVALIVDEFSVEKGTGIARYSYELYKGLKDRGIEVEPIMVKPPGVPFGQAINHVFRLPYRVLRRVNEFDIVHATSPITGLCFPFMRKPKVMTYHDIISMVYKDSGNSLHARVAAPLFFRVGKWSDRIISVSSQTKEELINHLKFPEEIISVINYGLDESFRPLPDKEDNQLIVGYVGAFNLRKRIDYLIQVFYCLIKKHPELDVKLNIYGPKGAEYYNIINLTKKLGLEHVIEFKGFISGDKLVEAYNSLNIFAITSEWEGFCMPIIEAQKCGVPVVIRKDAHIPQEAAESCVKADSKESMADEMFKLLTDSKFKERIVKGGLDHTKQFTWNKTVEKTIKVYEDLIK
ncbi:MAG: glycosyltransferase family 1 protein [Methanosarcinales archaeon]|nr:glycosyltransferase family 1 protein [Methanosarcinales archaeon]